MANSCVKKVGDGMTVKIYHEDPASRNPSEFAENSHHLCIFEMVREERAEPVIKLAIHKWKSKGVATNGVNFRKLRRPFRDCLYRSRVQFNAGQLSVSTVLSRPLGHHP